MVPKRDENGKWRRLHNKKLHSLYRSPNIVRVIKSRRLRWADHIARMDCLRNVIGLKYPIFGNVSLEIHLFPPTQKYYRF